jgi:pyrroloquinoline-quinone synthase
VSVSLSQGQTVSESRLTEQARARLSGVFPLDRTYFQDLVTGRIPLAQFAAQQRQFRFAVGHFARPLAALLARIADPALRDRIVRNVWEEHGQGDPARWHDATFRHFLAKLGVPAGEIDADVPGVAVDAFNTALRGLTATEDVATAAAALGMIELMFSGISAAIARSVVDHGWLPGESLVHYTLHAELDIEHAGDLFAVAATGSADLTGRGLALGQYLFDRLYEDLRQL